MPANGPSVVGVLLAGGLSRRMGGGFKCLRLIDGVPILDLVVDRAKPQVSSLLLNVNGDPKLFQNYDLPIIQDVIDGYVGPLAGILSGMEWVAVHKPDCLWLVSFATDAPFIPRDLVNRLLHSVEVKNGEIACAISNNRTQPVFALWPVKLRHDLRQAIVDGNIRKIEAWTSQYRVVLVEFDTQTYDPFFNANHREDIEEAEQILKKMNH